MNIKEAFSALKDKILSLSTVQAGTAALVDGLRSQIAALTQANVELQSKLAWAVQGLEADGDVDVTDLQELVDLLEANNKAFLALGDTMSEHAEAIGDAVAAVPPADDVPHSDDGLAVEAEEPAALAAA